MPISTSRAAVSLFALSTLLSRSSALPVEPFPARPQFSVVNVDGSSEPTYAQQPPPSITQAAAPTITSVVTVDVDTQAPTQTITVTVAPTEPPMPFWPHPWKASSTSSSPSSSWPVSSSTSTPCNTTTTSSSWITSIITSSAISSASPTPCDDDDAEGASPSDGAPWRPSNPILSTGVTAAAAAWPTYSYPPGAHAPHPSGMTVPLPVLPTDAPYWYNSSQVPSYRKRAIINE